MFRRLAPEIAAERPTPRDEATIRAGAEERSENVSEVWAWLAHPGLAVPRRKRFEQVRIAQRAGERRFATIVELLETADGDRLVRFAYTTGGSVRRGPVTLALRARDVERMQRLLERTPELQSALGRFYEIDAQRAERRAAAGLPALRDRSAARIALSQPRGKIRDDRSR